MRVSGCTPHPHHHFQRKLDRDISKKDFYIFDGEDGEDR
jgi:hypothetical protein